MQMNIYFFIFTLLFFHQGDFEDAEVDYPSQENDGPGRVDGDLIQERDESQLEYVEAPTQQIEYVDSEAATQQIEYEDSEAATQPQNIEQVRK